MTCQCQKKLQPWQYHMLGHNSLCRQKQFHLKWRHWHHIQNKRVKSGPVTRQWICYHQSRPVIIRLAGDLWAVLRSLRVSQPTHQERHILVCCRLRHAAFWPMNYQWCLDYASFPVDFRRPMSSGSMVWSEKFPPQSVCSCDGEVHFWIHFSYDD